MDNFTQTSARRRFTAIEIARMPRSIKSSLLFALENTLPPPCVQCSHYQICAEQELACEDFASYVTPPTEKKKKKRAAQRNPSKAIYEKIYKKSPDEDADYAD